MSDSPLTNLFQPLTINGMTVHNRIVVPPMGTRYGSTGHKVTEQLIAYYRRRAQGGTGLIICEFTSVHPEGQCGETQLGIYDDRFMPGFEQLARSVHEHGAKIALQIGHGGSSASPELAGGEIVAPSPIPDPEVGVVPTELTIPEIRALVEAFG